MYFCFHVSKSSDAFDIASECRSSAWSGAKPGAAQSLERRKAWSSSEPGAAQSLVRRKDSERKKDSFDTDLQCKVTQSSAMFLCYI